MGGKKNKNKNKKKCEVCMSQKHEVENCPFMVDNGSKGDACRKWCMVDLCTKLHKISLKMHEESSYEKIIRALEKLVHFESDLENAYEWFRHTVGLCPPPAEDVRL